MRPDRIDPIFDPRRNEPLMSVRACASALFLLSLAAAALAADVVTNPAEPRDGLVTSTLIERWRVGGEDGDELFGLIPRVATDDAGNVYVLDSQMCQVSVYSPDGEKLRTLFREGEGPGEVRQPRDMLITGDGRVGVVQEFPGSVSLVKADGDPAGRLHLGGLGSNSSMTACFAAGDVILASGTHFANDRPGMRDRLNILETLTEDPATAVRFVSNEAVDNFAEFVFTERHHLPPFWWCFAATPDGTVYTVRDRDAYAIEVFAADGTPLRTITREYEPLQRTQDEYDRMVGMIQSAMNGMPVEVGIEVERTESVVADLHRGLQLRPGGELWVLTGRGVRTRMTGVMAVYDVFDADGVFVRQEAFDAPHDGQDVGIFLSGSDRVLVVKGYFESLAAQFGNGATFSPEGEEPDVPEVICYEIVR